jgi:TrmH family RNA methyltransferase
LIPLSPRNRQVRWLSELSRDPNARRESSLFVVEGWKLVSLALQDSTQIYLSEDAIETKEARELTDAARLHDIPVYALSGAALDRISDTKSPQPVLAVAARRKWTPSVLEGATFVLACMNMSDPGNTGSILRIASASGAGAAIFTASSADPYSPKAVRASAGGILQVPVLDGIPPLEMITMLHDNHLAIVGTIAHGGKPYTAYSFCEPFALVIGNESSGLPDNIRKHMDASITIPLSRRMESLNAATAAAIISYEALRQRELQNNKADHGR